MESQIDSYRARWWAVARTRPKKFVKPSLLRKNKDLSRSALTAQHVQLAQSDPGFCGHHSSQRFCVGVTERTIHDTEVANLGGCSRTTSTGHVTVLVYILVLRLLLLDVITISECIGRFPLLFRLMKYSSLMALSEAVCKLVCADKYACSVWNYLESTCRHYVGRQRIYEEAWDAIQVAQVQTRSESADFCLQRCMSFLYLQGQM